MKFLFDLFPVILFFITLKFAEKSASASLVLGKILGFLGITASVKPDMVPIMLATIAVIVASILQVAWVKLVKRQKVDNALLISAVLVIVMGALTLYLQNDVFIKWKPTLLDWIFAVVLLAAEAFWGKNIIKTLMGKEIELPGKIWKVLNLSWAIFFILMGILNLYVAFNYSIDTWASFKLFGIMGLTFLFMVIQTIAINKYITIKDKE